MSFSFRRFIFFLFFLYASKKALRQCDVAKQKCLNYKTNYNMACRHHEASKLPMCVCVRVFFSLTDVAVQCKNESF